MRNQKYLRTTALISAPGWKIQSGDTHEWRDSCLEVTLEVESWGMETGWDMVRSVSKMLRCYVIFRFYLIFCILRMFRKLWLESFGTHLYTKHIKASHSITKLILQRPGLPFSRERRLQSQSKKSHQGLPFRALGFSTWIFFMMFLCFFKWYLPLFSIVFQKKNTNHRP